MTTTTINDRLVELGVLGDQQDKKIQRKGAHLIDGFFMSFNESDVDEQTTVMVLHYLTDTQVRDYAMGIVDKYKNTLPALNYLLDKAPTDTQFINAPASILAAYLYERGDSASATITLTNAQAYYPLASLLRRVMQVGLPPSMFGKMREQLHPKVVAGIFGEEE